MSYDVQTYSSYVAPTEAAPSSAWQGIRVHDAVQRFSSVDGEVTASTDALNDSGNAGQLNPYHGTDSVLATARNANGSPVTEINGTTLVTVKGTEAPVSFWVNEGYLQKGADGEYTSGTPNAAPEAASTADVLPLDAASMAAVNDALATVEQANLDSLIGVGSGVASGRLDEKALAFKFGQASGLDATESHARLTTIKANFQAQADSALTQRAGIGASDLPQFYAWAKANQREQLQEAVLKQLHGHDVSGYQALAAQWLSATPPSEAALKAGGIATRKQGTGMEVFVRGQWMSPGAAAKAGLI